MCVHLSLCTGMCLGLELEMGEWRIAGRHCPGRLPTVPFPFKLQAEEIRGVCVCVRGDGRWEERCHTALGS
jgi:hypothetical protein